MPSLPWPALAALLVLPALAGCLGGSDEPDLEASIGDLDVTSTTGGIRGVVVDQAIRPLKGVTVEALGAQKETRTTDENGAFLFSMLPPGEYSVRASHPLYSPAAQTTTVVAGIPDPPVLKVLLEQVVFDKPYLELLQYKGFIVCSVGSGFAASEECGEGVGVECVPPLQPPACGRVGGQGNNEVQFDFYVGGPSVRTVLVEQVWEPNAEATGELYTVLATEWNCTPTCGGNELNTSAGPSPLLVREDFTAASVVKENITAATRFSAFTWPNWGSEEPDQANVALNQEYELFVTVSYVLPLPKDYSFVAGSPDPFT